jgi:hypothetical protein
MEMIRAKDACTFLAIIGISFTAYDQLINSEYRKLGMIWKPTSRTEEMKYNRYGQQQGYCKRIKP